MKKNRHILVGVCILAATLLCVWGLLFYFVVVQARDIALISQKTAHMEQEERITQQMKLSIERDALSRQRVDSYFISSSTLVSFIEELETVAQRTGVALTIESLSQDEKKNIVTLGLTVRGSYSSVFRFTAALESSPHLIQIESILLSRAVGKGSIEWGAKIIGTMYTYEGNQ